MAKARCPGQDPRLWKPEDVSERICPYCGCAVEFWKDDVSRRCPGCNRRLVNPKLNLGCAEWCRYAEACLGADIVAQRRAANEAQARNPKESPIEPERRRE